MGKLAPPDLSKDMQRAGGSTRSKTQFPSALMSCFIRYALQHIDHLSVFRLCLLSGKNNHQC